MLRDVYSGYSKLFGEEHRRTIIAASNYATTLLELQKDEEGRSLLLKTIPVAQRVLGESNEVTLRMRWIYGVALYNNTGATLDDLREAATTLEETAKTIRQVYGGAHPLTFRVDQALRASRAALATRETPS